MRPLTLDDLMPLEEYAGKRREFFEAHQRYLDRYRRVRVGPQAALLFENRQTLWFRLQEVLRVARLADPGQVQEELNLYNRLLPGPNCLQAALLIEIADETRLSKELAVWQNLKGESLHLHLGDGISTATLITCRPEDRAIGAAHWVQFPVDKNGREQLANSGRPVRFAIDHAGYRHESLPLSADVRQSLLDDLTLSDKDS
jgi:hypothetical protein